ncbi:MAG: hypothetical protein GW907_01855 [Betaproteobacteria bacterium]|nr:hypothetical protein [Betaproteobacteria bacterium]NCS60393.1 hypothetical protein [Rhodoferax sp.]
MMPTAQPVVFWPSTRVVAPRARALVRLSKHRDFESVSARMLTQGGDSRITLNAQGLNTYGFAPQPDPALVQFGSSTGSVISAAGFSAAVALLRRLYGSLGSYHREIERQRCELSLLSGASSLPGTELVFAASGTDIHLFAVHLAAQGQAAHFQTVMAEPGETGSGVPDALAASHFAAQTSQGRKVLRGAPVGVAALPPAVAVKLRHSDGSLRSVADVDGEFATQVERMLQTAGRCLLVLTDVSKTGLLAPSMACAAQLRAQYGERLSILVDACQFRASPQTLLGYLSHDFMVAITGSKFVGGPAFCGALLLPPSVAQRSRGVALDALVDYSARSDWPLGWPNARVLEESVNLGLLLRWEAALTELRRFRALPAPHIHDFLQSWQQAVSTRLIQDDLFEPLPVAPLQRGLIDGLPTWDSVQTIFPFKIFKRTVQGHRRVLTLDEMTLVYRQLRSAQGAYGALSTRFALGQPVSCGMQDGQPVSALRLCSSARWVTESVAARQPVGQAIADAMLALNRIVQLVQALR